MTVKVFGVRNLDFVDDDGNEIKGKSILVVRKTLETERDVEGYVTDKVFIRDNSPIEIPTFLWGEDYDFIYEGFGKKNVLMGIKHVPKNSKVS